MIVPVASMRQTPGNQCVLLLVRLHALEPPLLFGAMADASLGTIRAFALLSIMMRVDQLVRPGAVAQLDHIIGQIAPIRSRISRNPLHPGLDEGVHFLGDVIADQVLVDVASHQPLERGLWLDRVLQGLLGAFCKQIQFQVGR